MSRVLVTGGSGFIGRRLVQRLLDDGYEVHTTSRTVNKLSTHQHSYDLTKEGAATSLISQVRPDILIHLAWLTEHGSYWTSPDNHLWRLISLNLFRAFAKGGGSFAMAAGTSAEYLWGQNEALDELTTPLRPTSLYGATKLSLWKDGHKILSNAGVPLCWVRLFNPFGPGENSKRLIPRTCIRLLRGEPIRMDAATEKRDFLHVDEVIDAFMALLAHRHEGAVNVGSGEPRTIRELVESIAQFFDTESLVTFERTNNNHLDCVYASTFLLRDSTCWQPTRPFSEQVASACSWWKTHYKQT